MAAFSNVDSLNLGSLLQIVFSNGVRNQISEDYRDFEYVSRFRVSDSMARERRFMLQSSYGPAAIQAGNPGARANFPRRQQSSIAEYTAKLKKYHGTVDIEYDMYDRARKSPEKYMEPLALEIQSKSMAAKRRIAADFHADGTGILAEVESAAAYNTTTDSIVLTLKSGANDPGHVGLIEYDDLLIITDEDGTARGPTGTTNFYAWKVTDKNREDNTVTIQAVSADGSQDTDAGDPTFAATNLLWRVGDPALVGVTSTDNDSVTSSIDVTGSISDYGTAGFVIPGLDSLLQDDARVVHGITMSGSTKATTKTLSNNETLDSRYIQQLLSQVKTAVGPDAYSWKMMTMSPEAHDALIDSREADRRFQSIEDNKRGVRMFAYVHGNDVLETNASEYCKPKKLYLLPEAKNGKKIFEYWGTDWETVKGEGLNEFHLNPSADGGHENAMVSYLQSYGTLICTHPAAAGVLEGFSV